MPKTRLLFVCTGNTDRSPTAEKLFDHHRHYTARSCGIAPLAHIPVSDELLEWSDYIICMEEPHRFVLLNRYPAAQDKTIFVLDIPDLYEKDEPELVEKLKVKLREVAGIEV